MKRALLAAVTLTWMATGRMSALDVAHYENARKEGSDPEARSLVREYMAGLVTGFGFANARLEIDNHPLLYCQPKSLGLNDDNYNDTLERVIEKFARKSP